MSDPTLDRLWDNLLLALRDRQIIPVIGPNIVTVPDEGGVAVPFVNHLAPRLAKCLGLPHEEGNTLSNVASEHLVRNGNRMQLYQELRRLVADHEHLPVPPGLADLAAIEDFDLFLVSTFDTFLLRALREARPGYTEGNGGAAAFHPNRHADLPSTLPGTFVFHVLGSHRTYPDFAVWEEDYMEFLCGMLEAPLDNRRNLFRELKDRSLLLIGAPFDDWTVRFFLRVAKQERLSGLRGKSSDYIADLPASLGEPLIFYFDKVVQSLQILPLAPVEFAAELRRRWELKYRAKSLDELLASIPDDIDHGSVFVSYSRDNKESAMLLAAGLKQAKISVWLDKSRLKAGGDWNKSLHIAVKMKSSLFLSLISEATEADTSRFVHQERSWAAERHVKGYVHYIPVLIDDVKTVAAEPEIFRHLHRHHLPGGKVTLEFAKLIKGYLVQYAKGEGIKDE